MSSTTAAIMPRAVKNPIRNLFTVSFLCLAACSSFKVQATHFPLPAPPTMPHLSVLAPTDPGVIGCLVKDDWYALTEYLIAVEVYTKKIEAVKKIYQSPTP